MYRIFIDSIEYETPNGWRDFTTTIKRDRSAKGVVVTQDATLTFTGDAYNYLYSLFITAGSAETVTVRVLKEKRGGYREIYNGTIFITDVEFDKYAREARTKIQDNSYYAKINNNKSVDVKLYAPRSKNNVSIPLAVPCVIEFFDYATGSYYTVSNATPTTAAHCRGFTVYEAFKFIVAFITDGEVLFKSTLFGPGGKYEGLCITNGFTVKQVQESAQLESDFNQYLKGISFDKLFQEVNKKLNIGFYIERGANGKPTIRIEDDSFFYQNKRILSMPDIDKITLKSATEYLYSSVEFGSSKNFDTVLYSFPENVLWAGFSPEQYVIQYKSNIDKMLSCKSEWVISSNVIVDGVEVGPTSSALNDEDIVLIDCAYDALSGHYLADQKNWLSTAPPYYYNHRLRNEAVAANFKSILPSSIINYSGAVDNGCVVRSSAATPYVNILTTYAPFVFDNEVSDPKLNYDSVTNYRYVAPAAGLYFFSVRILVKYANLFANATSVGSADLNIRLRHADSGGTTIAPPYVLYNINQNENFGVTFVIGGNVAVTMNTGDRITVEASSDGYYAPVFGLGTTVSFLKDSEFQCIAAFTGGAFQTTQFSNSPLLRAEFNYPVSDADYAVISSNPLGYIQYGMAGDRSRNAYVEILKLKHETYEGNFTLSTSQKEL